MDTGTTIVVLHNQITPTSPEDIIDVLVQADWIAKILERLGFNVLKLPFSLDSIHTLARLKETSSMIVFNMVDSDQDNLVTLVPSILDHLKIKYTGCSTEALFLTTNKVLTKRLLRSFGLPTPDWVCGDDQSFSPGQRYIIKALAEDASIGLDGDSVVDAEDLEQLVKAILFREKHAGKNFFAERYIEGREFNVAIYGSQDWPVVLPPYEWVFAGFEERNMAKIIDYDAKWTENTFQFDHVSAVYALDDQDSSLMDELKRLAEKCWRRFGLSGYARLDIRVDQDDKPWIIEINADPSFYGFDSVAKNHCLNFDDMIKAIIEAVA